MFLPLHNLTLGRPFKRSILRLRGGRTRANSVCFTKNVVKIGAFPNATPTSKIWKNWSVDQKDQRRRSVWVGHADFSKIAQRKQKFIKHVNCMFTQEN